MPTGATPPKRSLAYAFEPPQPLTRIAPFCDDYLLVIPLSEVLRRSGIATGSGERSMTDVALVAGAVPGRGGVPGSVEIAATRVLEQVFSNDTVGITLTKNTMNDAAVHVASLGTR